MKKSTNIFSMIVGEEGNFGLVLLTKEFCNLPHNSELLGLTDVFSQFLSNYLNLLECVPSEKGFLLLVVHLKQKEIILPPRWKILLVNNCTPPLGRHSRELPWKGYWKWLTLETDWFPGPLILLNPVKSDIYFCFA